MTDIQTEKIEGENHKYSPALALMFSLLPGLSLLYVGRIKKALAIFVIDLGIIFTLIYSESYIMKFLMAGIYLVTFLPASMESYQVAKFGKNTIDTESRWYVVLLLLTTGFSALPLLYQSSRFSKAAKLAWTIAVPVLAIVFFTALAGFWVELDHFLRDLLGAGTDV